MKKVAIRGIYVGIWIFSHSLSADPLLTNWLFDFSGQYARVIETNNGPAVTTWPSAGLQNNSGANPHRFIQMFRPFAPLPIGCTSMQVDLGVISWVRGILI